ncbi:MAG: PilZ domain-containing protein [Treponema sp.]|nr:PilZ domain-containing protein [Treponema sp.]
MLDNRKDHRYRTLAHARIPGVMEGENLLRDLSVTGCCIECTAHADLEPETQYRIEIIPESASHIGNFELTVQSKWIRSRGYASEVGFVIIASPKGKLFQRYVDYLDYRSSLA